MSTRVVQRSRNRYKLAMDTARAEAAKEPLPNVAPALALQWVVNRLYARLIHASGEVDKLGEGQLTVMTAFGPCDHEWVRAEKELTNQLSKVCVDTLRAGLDERLVQVEEAKAGLMLRAFTEAALESGISRDQLKSMAPAFRSKLRQLQGGEAPAIEPVRRVA